ncbi:MAG: hypothetical protein ACPGN4_02870 [Miltoncostaeaceae bacterium]
MTETGLIIGQAVFLLLLYLFIAFVVRASTRALRSSEIEMTPPRQADPAAAAPQAQPAPPTETREERPSRYRYSTRGCNTVRSAHSRH